MASLTHGPVFKLLTGATSTGASSAIAAKDFSSVMIQVSGIGTATVTMQSRVGSDAGWDTNGVVPVTNQTATTNITSDGIFRINIAGVQDWRANVTAYSAGTIDIWARMSDL